MNPAFEQNSPENQIALASTVLRSLDPQVLYSFFKKEADALDAALTDAAIDPVVMPIRQTTVEQMANAPRGISLLYSRLEDFQMRYTRMRDAATVVPELTTTLQSTLSAEIQQEWNKNHTDFLRFYTAFFNRIQVYGMPGAQDNEPSAANALNTRYSSFTTDDRDYLVAETFGRKSHLLFWDVTFCLKMQIHLHNQSSEIAKLTDTYRTRLQNSDKNAPDTAQLREGYKLLQQISADLPRDDIPLHYLERLRTSVETYIAARIARLTDSSKLHSA